MDKGRLEAFSDGVIAVIITIMVLELKVPQGTDWAALRPLLPVFLTYLQSFIYVGIYWNNHHHMLQACQKVNGRVLWANLHLLFWMSLVPVVTGWMGANHNAALPVALYGVVLLMTGIAYTILARELVALHGQNSPLGIALGRDDKGKLSLALYSVAIGLSFVNTRLAVALYVGVAIMWIVPDPRIEKRIAE
ncbi:MAG TPA: TMEM175 family protein [Candidatus Acidoferrum sp.]|nr:TMEM175 family protein [Candidatus Acidoferrum sp.]